MARQRYTPLFWTRLLVSLDGHKITILCRHMCGRVSRLAPDMAPDCIQPHVYFIDDSFGESANIVRWRPFSSCCMGAQVYRRRIVYTLSFVLFSYFLRQRHQRRALCPQLLGEPKDSRIRSNVGTRCCGRGSRR